MRYIIVGDIHGCHSEAFQLFAELEIKDDDKFISIGDIIHKGPKEERCISLCKMVEDFYILGNHEEKQLRWQKHEENRQQTGRSNPMMHVEDYVQLGVRHSAWLKDAAKLFHQFEVAGQTYLLVHGGIEPRLRSLPEVEEAYQLSKKEKSYSWNMLRTRYVNPKGGMVSLGDEKPEDKYWAEVYDGRFGHVIFGHQPFLERNTPREYEHATGIDLGCVYGGHLCAFIINEDGTTGFHTVKARDKYQRHRGENKTHSVIPS